MKTHDMKTVQRFATALAAVLLTSNAAIADEPAPEKKPAPEEKTEEKTEEKPATAESDTGDDRQNDQTPETENPAHFARPQTLDDWLSGPKPPAARPQTLADQPKPHHPRQQEG